MKKGTEIILKLLVSFFVIQLIGLYIGMRYSQLGVSITDDPQNISNAAWFFVNVLVGAVFILLLIKFYKKRLLFLVIEGIMIFFSASLVSSLFVDDLLSFLIGVGVLVGRHYNTNLKFAATAIACISVGALMGVSLGIIPAALFALALSVYDLVAVFGTKHMITMAKELSQKDLAFSFRVGEQRRLGTGGERVGIELGTGDVVVPIMLSVSFYVNNLSFAKSIWALVGATLGLMVVVYIVVKKKDYMPALPPIVLLSLLGGLLG